MDKCPTCGSPDPRKHPAMQFEGEVQPCKDEWHSMAETPKTVEVNVVMGAQLRAIVRSALIHVRNKVADTPVLDSTKYSVFRIIDEELEKWPLSAADNPEADALAEWLFKRFHISEGEAIGIGPRKDWDELDQDDQAYWEHEADAVRRAVGRGGFKHSDPSAGLEDHATRALHHVHEITGGEVKGFRDLQLKHAESLGEAIRIALGAASTCWTNMSDTGVFKSTEALDIATQLEHHFHSLMVLMNAQTGERHQELGDLLRKYYQDGHPMISVRQAQDILCGRSRPEEYASALQVLPNVTLQTIDNERNKGNG